MIPQLKTARAAKRDRPEVLRRTHNQLRHFVDTISIPLHWVSPDGVITWANEAELCLLGYSSEEYIGHRLVKFHADPDATAEVIARLCAGETIKAYPIRLKTKSGEIKHVTIDSCGFWENGRLVHSQCLARDVTDQKRAEEISRHFTAIIECSDDAIISKDVNGIIKSWNKGAERIFGYTEYEAIGRPVTLLIPADRFDEERNILQRILRGELIDHYETVRQRKDGTLLDISLTVSPIRDAYGAIVGASKIARDITERKRTQEALRRAKEQLAKTNEELERRVDERTASLREAIAQMEEFSYSVPHDLRSPVRAMHGYAKAAIEDYGDRLDAHGREYLERIIRGSTRMDRLIQDILTYSRIARCEIQVQPVSLQKLVPEIIQQYPEMHVPRAEVIIRDQLPSVLAHEPSLAQAISNLLSNGVKFVASGSIPRLQIWAEMRQDKVRLWIEDNGIGIKPEYQSRLFGMFERVHPDKQYSGTGIGLAIVRKAVERMGGQAGVASDGITGSSFWIELPAAEHP
jgi:PAS domain S-box-containing protein